MAQQQLREAAVVAGERERVKRLLLDAARVVLPLGAAAAISTLGNHGANDALAASLGLLLWLLGVCFLSLVPAADRFPGAALVGATMASAVLKHCFALISI